MMHKDGSMRLPGYTAKQESGSLPQFRKKRQRKDERKEESKKVNKKERKKERNIFGERGTITVNYGRMKRCL